MILRRIPTPRSMLASTGKQQRNLNRYYYIARGSNGNALTTQTAHHHHPFSSFAATSNATVNTNTNVNANVNVNVNSATWTNKSKLFVPSHETQFLKRYNHSQAQTKMNLTNHHEEKMIYSSSIHTASLMDSMQDKATILSAVENDNDDTTTGGEEGGEEIGGEGGEGDTTPTMDDSDNIEEDTSEEENEEDINDDVPLLDQLRPSEVVSSLDSHIVGQNDAKRAVAIAMRNRWRRRQLPKDLMKEVTPRNVLMIGPTGCG